KTFACDKPHYPFELPKGWEWTTVGEITNYGDSVNVQIEDIDNSDWVLELEDIEKDTANIIQHLNKNERKINGTRHKFQKGQILYSKLRTYLNKVLVAPNDGFCTTEIMAFGSYGILSNNYICYVLRSLYFLDYTLQCGYGVKMPRLSTTDACNGLIPLPPLAEQERIVNEIQRLFSIIDIVENGKDGLQTAIQQAKNKILDLAIHGKLVPQDPNDETATELLKRINPKAEITCDNPQYGKLPKGWCETTLKSLAKEVFAGGDKPTEFTKEKTNGNIIPIYANGVEKDGLYGYTNAARVIEPCLTVSARGTIGFTCIRNIPFVPIVRLITIVPNPVFDLKYMKFCLDSLLIWSEGSSIPQLTVPTIKKMQLPLPPLQEQHRIVAKIEELFTQFDKIEEGVS
uniref:restriction endonuclease subunit S n=1 Tax=Segatella hominis TaxID=2518605 RepID=UPI004027C3B2